MKKINKKGFTLLELLVVIAIIGILSAVVLGSLSSARGKGNNAAVKSELHNFRTQSELLSPDYSTACDAGTDSRKIYDAAVYAATSTDRVNAFCNATADTYMAAVTFISPENSFVGWCVDNSGVSKGVVGPIDTTNYNTATACGN